LRGRSPTGARRALVVAVVALVAVTGGCSDDGRDLAEPRDDQTTTLPTTSTTATGLAPMAFSSPAFRAGEAIPERFTCDGQDISPPLAWSDIPAGAVELAVVMSDPDANGFVHWVLAGVDAGVTGLEEGTVPDGAVQARNDAGETGWSGPCPPSGTHTYVFTLYALPEPAALDPSVGPLDAAADVQEAAIATATFSATYQRA
jgi:Raf kinase inhibitor-like YbhB/YbcL family protein